ncbi:ABC transporter type 1, transmembrane domain-containing protein [Lentinula aciculospora]|uniref:ABC transporter type 1, transmembrane domain-containing protein n=1 Tax=Lentinula aciculospora TaxID=153920 RepID=A0A9W9AQK1_9AGAR|nr:ABC transporter type 1, transmembrane domain-containing protein [Lentinula aciculospora]
MGLKLCPGASPTEFSDVCIRETWSTLVLTVFVFWLYLFAAPHMFYPQWVIQLAELVKKPFKTYLTLHEAEALGGDEREEVHVEEHVPLWRTLVFAFVGLVEIILWLATGAYNIALSRSALNSFLNVFVWSYTVARPVLYPSPTVPYDLFCIYNLQLVSETFQLGGMLFTRDAFGLPLPSTNIVVLHAVNLCLVVILLAVVLCMPMAIPSRKVNRKDIGETVTPEDYAPLGYWITFAWVYPLIRKGKITTLNEEDVWALSPTIQSRPIFAKFMNIQTVSLAKRLLWANSLDLILEFLLSTLSVFLEFLNPFFLNHILSSIETGDRPQAYVYAVLMFLGSVLKSQSDLHHLWFSRRAATRTRSELMAVIYDKALKRKDLSGIVRKEEEKKDDDKEKGGKSKKDSQEDKEKEQVGADVGKIVNLMAGDANRVSMTITAIYMMYNAPFEIVIGLLYLYNLLGPSALVGLVVLVAGWPLNTYLTKRSMEIYRGTAKVRDKRMGVVSELIGAIKFIKFFAWEYKWIDRAMDEREKEMTWMLKSRINSIMFYILWQSTPILVSIISFMTYVLLGNELTVSVAFTAIALFGMIRTPLNVLPNFVVQVAQTKVALDRIAGFLDEEEVTEQVSSLKKDVLDLQRLRESHDENPLGLENATCKWNEVESADTDKGKQNGNHLPSASNASEVESVTVRSEAAEIEQGDHQFRLEQISIVFPEDKLTVVTGPTASGKTALLMAVLGEMTLLSGRILMRKDTSKIDANGNMLAISYAAQSPWLRHQSIRDNILFGYPYDEQRYQAVIEACALEPDLDILEDGDHTEIGARGVSLSGGQKARVALARAVYARTKYVLLDDPLSAVDSHTSRFLYEKLLRGPLLASRTVILVTHHIDLVLPGAHYLVRMLDGRIDTQGTVADLRASGLLEDIAHEAEAQAQRETQAVAAEETAAVEVEALEGEDLSKDSTEETKKPRKLVEDEKREQGGVKWRIYKKYLQASSYWVWGLLIFFVILNQFLAVGEKYWIKVWGEAYDNPSEPSIAMMNFAPVRLSAASEHGLSLDGFAHQSTPSPPSMFPTQTIFNFPSVYEHPLFYVGVYAGIGVLNALVSVIATAVQYTGALRASRILFKQLLVTVVRATFRFHDTTPQGRMLNRFGKDIETIDSSLAGSLQNVNSSLANFFASVITIAVIFPFFLVPATVLGFIYRELSIGYLNTGRDLRRMESNSRSPIFSDFSELLEGIVTVRAFSSEKRFLDNIHTKIDFTTRMWYGFWMTNRWLLLCFDAVLITALFSISRPDASSGLAGICITSALSFTMSVYWSCRFWTTLELDLNSVERIVEYLDLPQEPPVIIESNRPPAYWPSSSQNQTLVSVENLSVKYAPDLPAVIQDVSFSLRAGERIGLLGRTGRGKIIIDGIDISTIGIHDLRSRLTFIPQDATLFSGTLRENLDPFGEHTDAECLDVLQRVQMTTQSQFPSRRTSRAPSVAATPTSSRPPSITGVDREDAVSSVGSTITNMDGKTTVSLDTRVSPGGTNFSQGQRQLISMARALLRRSSVVVLDEATSSIDFATDAKIQATIREEFTGSLLLTVAHRLRTIIDYDRLVVLDKGKVVELDTPWNLIQKEDGIFRTMCLKSGTFTELEAAAKAKAETTAAFA